MKNVLRSALVLTLLVIPAVSANATDFALFGSVMDTDDFDSSVGGGLKVDFPLGGDAWAMEIRASFYPELGSSLNDFVDDVDIDADAFEVSATPVEWGVTYGFGEGGNFFFGGGLSYVFLSADRNLLIDI